MKRESLTSGYGSSGLAMRQVPTDHPHAMNSGVEHFLSAVPYLSEASAAMLRSLSALSVMERISSEEILLRADDKSGYLWFVRSGVVLSSVLLSSGRSLTVDLSRPGEGIGEARVLGKETSFLQLQALVDSVVVGVPLRLCREAILGHPENMKQYARCIAAKHIELQDVRRMAIESAPRRVLHSLIWFMEKLGRELPVTRRTIADATGLSRETVVRTLSPLEKKGWVRTRKGRIAMLRPDKVVESLAS